MIRTTVVGSWPVHAQFTQAMHAYHTGAYPSDQTEQLLAQVARVAIEQQRTCGLDEITGGETSADTFILQFPKYLTGIEATGNHQAWGGRGTYLLTELSDAPRGLGIAAAFRREQTIDPAIGKVTIPGPSEITMMIDTETDTEDKIDQLLAYVPADRLLICPSCGFGRRNTEPAIQKSTAMVQAVRNRNRLRTGT